MGRKDRFVPGDVDRIELSDGDWIEVKRQLNTGDQKRLENAGVGAPVMVNGQVVYPIDWERHDIDRALIVVTDWSLTRADDKGRDVAVRFSRDAIKALDPDFFAEINRAIVNHILGKARERTQARTAAAEAEAQAKNAEREAASPGTTPIGSQPTTTPPPNPTSDAPNSTESAPTS